MDPLGGEKREKIGVIASCRVHGLRHTCATELLNAGMRLEYLQQVLGHSNLEQTRRYARLTDKTREEEYFRAMAVIEGREKNGDGSHCEVPAVFEETQLLGPHDQNLYEHPGALPGMVVSSMEEVTSLQISAYIDFLLAQGLAPKTINCRLDSVRGFFNYLSQEEGIPRSNPVKKGSAFRLARPLPQYFKDEEVIRFFQTTRAFGIGRSSCRVVREEVSFLQYFFCF